MPRLLVQHTVEAPASPEAVWRLWQDPLAWPRFWPTLGKPSPLKPLQVGVTLLLRDRTGGGARAYRVAALEPGTTFTLVRRLLFADLEVLHRVDPSPLGARLHLKARLSGPLGWFHAWRLGRTWREAAPALLRALAKAAQA